MSRWNRLFSYFPLLMTVATLAAVAAFAHDPSIWTLLLLFAVLYILPPTVQRVMFRWSPLKLGVSTIDDRHFSAWLAASHIQAFYDALPQLESLLRVIPGFYSMWLRLWGSRVGYGVEWPVRMDVLDRNLMDIGNRVVFSHEVELSAHCRNKMETAASRILVREVHVGSHAFIGTGARLDAGAAVPSNASVPEHSVIGVNTTFGGTVHHPAPEDAEFVAA
jgi:acetyltransferase-like isoleucine patch superfamily enzyme